MPHLYRPVLAANDTGAWIGNSLEGGTCDGCGLPSALYHVSTGANAATVVISDTTSFVCWMLGDGGHVWVGMGVPFYGCSEQSILRFDGDSPAPVFQSPARAAATNAVVGAEANGLWTVVPDPPTSSLPPGPLPTGPYPEDVLRIDPDTGSETVVARLNAFPLPPVEEALQDGQGAYFDGCLYVLEPPFQEGGDTGYSYLVKVPVGG